MAFAALHETDHFAEQVEAALQPRRRPGPKPQFTELVEVKFTEDQVTRMTARAKAEKRPRNALIRAAVEAYLSQAGA